MSNRKFPDTCFAQTFGCQRHYCVQERHNVPAHTGGRRYWLEQVALRSKRTVGSATSSRAAKEGRIAIAISYAALPAIWSVEDRNLCVSAVVESTKLVRTGGLTVTLLRWALLF